jgi:hypothetical protein
MLHATIFCMSSAARNSLISTLKAAIVALPWLVSMYFLYWLEYSGIWTVDTPHRGKTSVTILLLGMGLSFFLFTRLFKRQK